MPIPNIPNIPNIPTKVRPLVLTGVAVLALFLLLATAVAVQWFRPSADVLVSEVPTYITAPLGDDGLSCECNRHFHR